MKSPPISVVYLAHGRKRMVEASIFSAFTLTHAAAAIGGRWRLVVYTDRPQLFHEYGVDCDVIPIDCLRDTGVSSVDYPHRLKILALRHCGRTYDGGIFYLDGDTYFLRSPETLFNILGPETSILHTAEYTLSDDRRPELYQTVKHGAFRSQVLRAARAQPDLVMWNAGAIGVGEANKHLLDEVLKAADELYGSYSYHIVEQLSWSLALSEATDVVPAADVVYHYWAEREQVMYEVIRFLRRHRRLPPETLALRAFALQPRVMPDWKPPLGLRARRVGRAVRDLTRSVARAGRNPREVLSPQRDAPTSGPDRDHALERERDRRK